MSRRQIRRLQAEDMPAVEAVLRSVQSAGEVAQTLAQVRTSVSGDEAGSTGWLK